MVGFRNQNSSTANARNSLVSGMRHGYFTAAMIGVCTVFASSAVSAQTLWLQCEISSSSGLWAQRNSYTPEEHFQAGETVIFGIGDRTWGRWMPASARLEADFCSGMAMETSRCDFAPTYFRARLSNGLTTLTMSIDRTTGQFSAVASPQPGYTGAGSVNGSCRPTTEPAAPQTRF